MRLGGSSVSQAFRELADVLETLETADHEITAAEPVDDEFVDAQTVALQVGVRVPFLTDSSDDVLSSADLSPTDVALQDDGTLQIEFRAAAHKTGETQQTDQSTQTAEEADTHPKPNSTSKPGCDDKKRPDHSSTTDDSTPETTDQDVSTEQEPPTVQSHSSDAHVSADDSSPEDQDEDTVPPYQDPERLQAVYDAHETFAEMTDALDVDVTSQTVRRYMIQHDIHQPNSNTGSRTAETLLRTDPDAVSVESTGSTDADHSTAEQPTAGHEAEQNPSDQDQSAATDTTEPDPASQHGESPTPADSSTSESTADSSGNAVQDEHGESTVAAGTGSDKTALPVPAHGDSPQKQPSADQNAVLQTVDEEAIAAAVDLPANVTLADVKDIARNAKTLFEAQQRLGVERDRTRELLRDLNLLEFVHGRLANGTVEDPTTEEINRRIRAQFAAYDDGSIEASSPTPGRNR